jgi:hypothetical protein
MMQRRDYLKSRTMNENTDVISAATLFNRFLDWLSKSIVSQFVTVRTKRMAGNANPHTRRDLIQVNYLRLKFTYRFVASEMG